MESKKAFTEEATKVLEGYVSAVSKALEETELTHEEIEESVEELRYHIIAQCEIRSKGDVISTDLVRLSIKKLGDPKTIAESLQSELNFSEEVKDEQFNSGSSPQTFNYPPTSGYKIKASHMSALYGTFCWLMTATVVFVAFDQQFRDLAYLFALFYGMAVGGLIMTRNLDAYMYNRHLQRYVKPNIHTSIVPLIYVIFVLYGFVAVSNGALWTVPASLVLWLILASTEYGRQYYLNLASSIFNTTKNLFDNIKENTNSTHSQ